MEEIVEHLGEMIMEAVPALAVLAFLVSVYNRILRMVF